MIGGIRKNHTADQVIVQVLISQSRTINKSTPTFKCHPHSKGINANWSVFSLLHSRFLSFPNRLQRYRCSSCATFYSNLVHTLQPCPHSNAPNATAKPAQTTNSAARATKTATWKKRLGAAENPWSKSSTTKKACSETNR